MIGDYPFLAMQVAREIGEPLTQKDMEMCRCVAADMVEIIRTYLPVKGLVPGRGHESWQVQERAAADVGELYAATEAIRNPGKFAFGAGRGTNEQFDKWTTSGMHTFWTALCHELDRLAEFYGWEDVSTGKKLPSMPSVRDGELIPAIPRQLLDDLEAVCMGV